jgi:hypothetical protein
MGNQLEISVMESQQHFGLPLIQSAEIKKLKKKKKR